MEWLKLWCGLPMIMLVPFVISCATSSEGRVKHRDTELCVLATGEDRVMVAVLDKNTLNSLEITPEQACCYLRCFLGVVKEKVADVVAEAIVGDGCDNSEVVPSAMDKLSIKELKAGAEMLTRGVRIDIYSLDNDGHIQKQTGSNVLKGEAQLTGPASQKHP